MKQRWNLWLPVAMMLVFAASRWPGVMPDNFSAAYAIAFCAGVYFPGKLRWWLPLTAILGMDLILSIFYYHAPALSVYTLINLLTFALLIWLGTRFSPRSSWLNLLSGGLLGALLFYLITNTASWIFDPGYPKTLSGWIQALTTGLPQYPSTWTFFRNTLLSGGLFTGLFAGTMKLGEAAETAEQEEPAEEGEEPLPEKA